MADSIILTEGARFAPHPEGTVAARCVDVIDLGEKVETFPGSAPKVVKKCALVFRTGEKREDGEFYEVSVEFTQSIGPKSGLRAFAERWRGKAYTSEALRRFDLANMEGQPALITVEHKTSGAGRVYAKIASISPVPKGLTIPDTGAYARPEYWRQRMDQYREEVARFRWQESQAHPSAPVPHDDHAEADDDLPF